MLLIRTDAEKVKNAVAVGRIAGRYKSYRNKKGFFVTEFSMCIKFDPNTKEFRNLKVCAYGDYAERIVRYAKLNKEPVVAFGICSIDKAMTGINGDTCYSMYASALLCPRMILETYEWHQNSLDIDKILSENYESNIRYDYKEEQKAEDHRI